jgi:hypothetical protein
METYYIDLFERIKKRLDSLNLKYEESRISYPISDSMCNVSITGFIINSEIPEIYEIWEEETRKYNREIFNQ